ncbi:unnamed protein product, partial [Didymodactylos carnosus]
MVAPILYVTRDEHLAYAGFCSLMRYMSSVFNPDGVLMKKRLNLLKTTIKAIDPELSTKIEEFDTGNMMFAYRWLLLDCKREFPFKNIFCVFETLWSSLPLHCFDCSNTDLAANDLCPHYLLSSSVSSHEDMVSTTLINTQFRTIPSISVTLFESRSPSSSPTKQFPITTIPLCHTTTSFFRSITFPPAKSTSVTTSRSSSISHPILSESSSSQNLHSRTSVDSGRGATEVDEMQGDDDEQQQIGIPFISPLSIPLGKWLINFVNDIDDDDLNCSMFTIFLCVAILLQHRQSIMQFNDNHLNDDCDFVSCFFTRMVRQHDSHRALQTARHYFKQYTIFKLRLKHLLSAQTN